MQDTEINDLKRQPTSERGLVSEKKEEEQA